MVQSDFNQAWLNILKNCTSGVLITFGDSINPKSANDTVQNIVLIGNAITQILNSEIHPAFPFKMTEQYKKEFSFEFLASQDAKPHEAQFAYTYYDRLARYPHDSKHVSINQLCTMKKDLNEQRKTGILSNRSQAITWRPTIDLNNTASPCLQRIRIRYEGDDQVSIHLNWRSRDAWGAWQVNLVAIIGSIYEEIVEPNDCTIARVYDTNDSLHVYLSSMREVMETLKQYTFRGVI